MAIGISVHVGVNETAPEFGMTSLGGCVHDAEAMREVALAHNFDARPVLRNDTATLANVKQEIVAAANRLNKDKNGVFLFTFAGHGSKTGISPTLGEDDGQDETILLSDAIVIDDYIRRVLWSKFDAGVRVLAIADCCHGGSALFAINLRTLLDSVGSFFGSVARTVTGAFSARPVRRKPRIREFTDDDARRINNTNLGQTNSAIIRAELASEGKEPQATLLTLAGCNDFEDAQDGDDHGAFTKAMLEVLCDQAPPPDIGQIMPRILAISARLPTTTNL
jgi:hypothetical protein